jgi:GAF domain-containing protein
MAGIFELFTDLHSNIRFRLLAPDGTLLALSQCYPDKRAAATAIASVRECAGTGLIQDHCTTPTHNAVGPRRPYRRHKLRIWNAHMIAAATPKSPLNMEARLQDLLLDNNNDVRAFLDGLATLAATTLSRAGTGVSCGITVTRRKKPTTLASSEPAARSMDELQNTLGEGPCLTALTEQTTVLTPDLNDEHRWPRFAQSAAGHGVRSILGVPLPAEGESRAVLNLCANRPNAFSREDISTAEMFAEQASRALRLALRIAQLSDASQNLFAALAHRTTIDLALGVVMAQNRCSHDAAFAILQRAASARQMKLRDVAASLISSVSGEKNIPVHFDT